LKAKTNLEQDHRRLVAKVARDRRLIERLRAERSELRDRVGEMELSLLMHSQESLTVEEIKHRSAEVQKFVTGKMKVAPVFERPNRKPLAELMRAIAPATPAAVMPPEWGPEQAPEYVPRSDRYLRPVSL
jgi:hypothetical protein